MKGKPMGKLITIAEGIEAGVFGVAWYNGEKYALLGTPDITEWGEMVGEENVDDDTDLSFWDIPEDKAYEYNLAIKGNPETFTARALAVKVGEPLVDGKRTCYQVVWHLDGLDLGAPVACSRDNWQDADEVKPFTDEPLNWPIPGQEEKVVTADYVEILPILADKYGVFFDGVVGYVTLDDDLHLTSRDGKDVFFSYALKIGQPVNEDGTIDLYEILFDVAQSGDDIRPDGLIGVNPVGTTTEIELGSWVMPTDDDNETGMSTFYIWHKNNG